MSPVEVLLSRLKKVRKSGDGWSAQCPAHDDGKASLAISEGDDGRALLTCHANCEKSAILAAVGLTWADLFTAKSGASRNRNDHKSKSKVPAFPTAEATVAELERRHGQRSAMWTYHDAGGQPVGFVVRWDWPGGRKDFRPVSRHDDGWRISAMPPQRPLFNLPELAPASRVVVTEGEKAADAARSLGFTATTSAGGAAAVEKTDWRPLAGKEVWILPDNDAPGRKYAEILTGILATLNPPATIRIIELPDLPEGGDIVEWIAAHGDAAEPEALRTEIEAMAETAPVGIQVAESEWPEIESFDQMDLPDFPTHALPDVLRTWVEATSHATQTPADLAGLLALAVCSAGIARRVVVEPRPGWTEPANLFVAVLLEPGNRKSAVFTEATKPLRELESELIEAARPTIARQQSERRQDELRLKKLEKLAAENQDEVAREEAVTLSEKLAEQAEPVLPRLLVDDATAEKLGMMLAEHGGRIASMSPEGGVFDLMAGQYSKSGAPQFGVYLMGHSGDELITDRVSRKSVHVKQPALTCAYAIQPAVIQGLADKPAFRGRGLLARFLYASPNSWIGRREVGTEPVSDAVREAYRQKARALATLEGDHVLRLARDASVSFREWETEIESMLADGGTMELMRDWGAKLAGAALRLAAVLHCVKHGPSGQIDRESIASAIGISQYLIPHAEAALTLMQANDNVVMDDARYLLRWIERHAFREFTKRDAHQHCKRRFPRADDIDAPLAELTRRGYIRLRRSSSSGPGRPLSPMYDVNPKAFSGERAGKRSQNSRNSADLPRTANSGNSESGPPHSDDDGPYIAGF